MKKRLASLLILVAYIALLIKVMVFKDIPAIKVGQLMLNFGGTDGGHAPNFIPFATIGPYLLGYKGWIIAGINLAGNVGLLVPLGFLLPLVFPNISWKKSLVLAVLSGLAIETMQTILHVGIFDIDDVILNALGVMLGFAAYVYFFKWLREKKYFYIVAALVVVAVACAAAFYFIYPWGQPVNRAMQAGVEETSVSQTGDLCGGTGGIGVIASVGDSTFTIIKKDGSNLNVALTGQAIVKTSAGLISVSDLKAGERVTLVGDAHDDGSFTADAVFVCSM